MRVQRSPRALFRGVILAWVVTLAGGARGVAAADEPTAVSEAEAAIRYADAGDGRALGALAREGPFDPWVIADELQAMGRADVARALGLALVSKEGEEGTGPGLAPEAARIEDGRALLLQLSRERPEGRDADRSRFAAASALPDAEAAGRVLAVAPLLPPARADLLPALRSLEPADERGILDPALVSILDARVAYLLATAAPAAFSDPEAVVASHRLAIRLARCIGWSRMELRVAGDLAAWAHEHGRLAAIRGDLDGVLVLARGRERWLDTADLLRAYGAALLADSAQAQAAAGYFRAAARIYDRAGVPLEEARTLSHLGSALLETGELAEALELQLRAGAILDQSAGSDDGLAHAIQVGVAAVYESLGMLSEAEALLRGLLLRLDAGPSPDPWAPPVARGNLGRVRFLAGDVDQARGDLLFAERTFRALGGIEESLDALALQGWCDAASEAAPQARDRVQASLRTLDCAAQPLQCCNLAEALARCLVRDGRPDEAVLVLKPMLAWVGQLEVNHTQRMDALGAYGAALVAAGRFEDGLVPLDQFRDLLLAKVDGMETASGRTFRGMLAAEALAAGMRAARELGDASRLWTYMEAARAIHLLAALGGRSLVEDSVLPGDLKARLQEAAHKALVARQALARAAWDPSVSHEARALLRAARKDAEDRRDAVAQDVKRERERLDLGELKRGATLLALGSARRALTPNEALVCLSGALPGDEIQVMVVTRDAEPKTSAVTGRRALAEAARGLRRWNAAEEPQPGTPERASTATHLTRIRALLAPIKLPVGATRILVVPDGDLAYIPYAAVWDDRDVGLLPCASILPRLRPYISRRSGSRALALGVSDYSSSSVLAVDATLLARLTPSRVRGGPLTLRGLPSAVEEARRVAGPDGVALLNADANSVRLLEVLTQPDAPVWSTIHFVCHGIVNADHPQLSALALSDGLLTAREIFPLHLKADMVVLSACETATDPYVMGEGLSGLVRAFLGPSMPRVIASLWEVPDDATAALMTHFYELLRSDPEISPSTALRRAQAAIRKQWPAPESWAAWTLWGAP